MKRILLSCSVWLLLLGISTSTLRAQDRTITGKVTSAEDGTSLPGVNVIVKGTTTGTTTNAEGNYTIAEVTQNATLVFSFIGLVTQEIAIGEQNVVNVKLASETQELSEVVVTAIGIESSKRSLGYSIQEVNADELVKARETNLVNALNSKVAGVTVVGSSGSPGASANIRIRGNTSINGSNSPLFVVDGVPIDNSSVGNDVGGVDNSNRAIDINPNDIQSLSILKGPAATVLYGIRAANGAVIITTKKGKSGRPTITFNSAYTLDQVNKLPELQTTYAQGRPGDTNGDGVLDAFIYRGPETGEGNSFGPRISDLEFSGETDYAYDKNGSLVPRGTGNGIPAKAYDPYTFFVNGQTFDNNISVSGGSDVLTYYFSAGRLSQTGIVPNSDFQRNSFKTTIDAKLSDKLSAGISANYVNSGGNRIQRGSNISGVMLGLLRNTPTFDISNGYDNGNDAADDPTTYQLPDGTQRSYRAGIYDNPYWTVNKNPFKDNVNRVIGNVNASYQLLPWLKASYKLGIDFYNDRRNSAFDINSAAQPTGQVNQFSRSASNLNSDFLLQVNRDLSESFSLNASIGHNYFSTNVVTQETDGFTLGAPGFYHISNATDLQASETISRRKLHGVFGNVNIGFRNLLFLELSGRNDWSSTLPENNNSFFYPAASVGFVFTEAFGMNESNILPYGKLRFSAGQVGNDALLYATANYFNKAVSGGDGFTDGITFPAFGVNAFERDAVAGNPNIKAELTTTYEVGGEFKFLKNRLGLDVTYYDKTTTDQIIEADISPATGFNGRIINAGTIKNTGIELVFNATPVQTPSFNWNIDVNFTRYRTEVEELAPGVETITLAGFTSTSSRVVAGQPYGAIYGSRFQRNDGGQLIIGANGWPLVEPTDGVIGNPNPDWVAGVRNTFSYKGLTLTALLDIRQGGDIWNGTGGIIRTFGTAKVTGDEREITGYVYEGVTEAGEVNTTPVDFANPALGISGNKWTRYAFGGISEESIEDGSWVRLREVTLTYSLPAGLFKSIFVSGASISLTGRNLFLITDYTGIDPETNLTGASNGFGLEYFNMPNTRSYGASINVTF